MWRNFDFLRVNIKSKLLDGIRFFLSLELDSARYFIMVLYFYFLDYTFWIFRWDQSSKIEESFIH